MALRWTDRLGRWLVGLLLIAAALPKLGDIRSFAEVVAAYGVLPSGLVLPVAFLLPLVELVLALGLIVDNRQSKIATILLLLGFVTLLAWAIHQGLAIDCGCFGPEEPEYQAFHGLESALIRDIILLVPLGYSLWYQRYRYQSWIWRKKAC